MLYAIVALLVIILDQWTKLWVHSNEKLLPKELIEGVISIVNKKNPGGAFSFLADKNVPMIFVGDRPAADDRRAVHQPDQGRPRPLEPGVHRRRRRVQCDRPPDV